MIRRHLKLGDKVWVHHSGKTFLINQASQSASGLGAIHDGAEASGTILSPMPGKVLKINVAKSDKIKKGETLCVIEAMKMEYSLKAPFDAKVIEIVKAPGQSITLGEKIMELEK